jgi:SAM-dependent methyltransferase
MVTKKEMSETPTYGNWVAKKLIYLLGLISLVFFGLSCLFPVLVILAIVFLFICLYFIYAWYLFAPQGGNVQNQIHDLLSAQLQWNGEGQALDIGCGNAALTIKLAHKYPHARFIGIDYWGNKWEFSKHICEKNARFERVQDRVTFQKTSASALPFPDGSFDVVVSNLVFHEVRDAKDKKKVLHEALRVVKNGGTFAFQDLFLMKRLFGDIDDLLQTIRSWGINQVEFIPTRDATFIPRALKLPFMVGTMGIISGKK